MNRVEAGRVRVIIAPPVDGWATVRMNIAGRETVCVTAYTPTDAIERLVEVADAIVAGPDERVATFYDHPEQSDLCLARGDDPKRVALRLVRYRDHLRTTVGEAVLNIEVDAWSFGLAVWRAMQALRGHLAEDAYLHRWRHPFPTRLVRQLGERVREQHLGL